MAQLVLEVGMKLSKSLEFYQKMLKENGFKMEFSCKTYDIYYTQKENFDGLTENQIKNSCIRIRNGEFNWGSVNKDIKSENDLIKAGYKKVFDTTKKDYHYTNGKIKSRIQLQEIENIGLLVYYDNPDYYSYDEEKQRKLLLEELNSYGFNFKETDLGLDKLRTLYYKKEMFSNNQNS